MPAFECPSFLPPCITQLTDKHAEDDRGLEGMQAGFCVNEASQRITHNSLHGHHAKMALASSHYTLRAQDAEDEDADPTAGMYAKYDRCLHGPRSELTQPLLSVAFLRKFLTIIKRRARCAASLLHGQNGPKASSPCGNKIHHHQAPRQACYISIT